jgi:hypothetical protein
MAFASLQPSVEEVTPIHARTTHQPRTVQGIPLLEVGGLVCPGGWRGAGRLALLRIREDLHLWGLFQGTQGRDSFPATELA